MDVHEGRALARGGFLAGCSGSRDVVSCFPRFPAPTSSTVPAHDPHLRVCPGSATTTTPTATTTTPLCLQLEDPCRFALLFAPDCVLNDMVVGLREPESPGRSTYLQWRGRSTRNRNREYASVDETTCHCLADRIGDDRPAYFLLIASTSTLESPCSLAETTEPAALHVTSRMSRYDGLVSVIGCTEHLGKNTEEQGWTVDHPLPRRNSPSARSSSDCA